MAKKYLKRRFTVRETVLLCVLLAVLLLGLYFGLVFYPIHSRTAELNKELDNVAVQKQVVDELKKEYDEMKAEIDRIKDDDTVMPPNDNDRQYQNLVKEFTRILITPGLKPRINNSVGAAKDGVITRTVTIGFTVDDEHKRAGDETVYDTVRNVLLELMTTEYRCSMRSLTLRPDEEGLQGTTCKSVTVTTVIEFFELA